MSGDFRRRKRCRLCGSESLTQVLSLVPTPPANAFVPAELKDHPQQVFPLDVYFCDTCAHVQLLDVVNPKLLFENYVYVSGTSLAFVKHFEDYARGIVEEFSLAADSLIVDIGSNDGTLLGFFKERGMRVLGIDPARDIAAAASARGIETLAEFFVADLAGRLRDVWGAASVITANNVFAHADDLSEILAGVRQLLAPDGIFVFEVSYLVDVYEKTLFDTIYHEHLAYHSVKPLQRFFAVNGMQLIRAERVESHGGSLRGTARLAGGLHDMGTSVADLIGLEDSLGLDRVETLQAFGAQIDAIKDELSSLLGKEKAAGKRIAAFGAPAKATTLMHHFCIGPDVIDLLLTTAPSSRACFHRACIFRWFRPMRSIKTSPIYC